MVGSLFGLKPYSSTSFLLNSSASFLCFRLRHRKRAARTIKATAATGTTTATAIFPPGERPEPLDVLGPEVVSAAEPDLDADDAELLLCVMVGVGKIAGDSVDVTSTVWAWFVIAPPALLVVCGAVKTEVSMCVVGGASVVWATGLLLTAAGADDTDTTETGRVEIEVATDVVSTVTALFEVVTPLKLVVVMTG